MAKAEVNPPQAASEPLIGGKLTTSSFLNLNEPPGKVNLLICKYKHKTIFTYLGNHNIPFPRL